MIEVKRKLITIDEVLTRLDAIHLDVQNKFHDQWNWIDAAFYVECLRCAVKDKDAEIARIKIAIVEWATYADTCSTNHGLNMTPHQVLHSILRRAALSTAPEGEKNHSCGGHQWVCGLDQQQCMENCGGVHDPMHMFCRICGIQKVTIRREQAQGEKP